MAFISFGNKKGLIEHGFKDLAIRQKKESNHWSNLDKGQNLKVFWRMRSDEKELLKDTELAEDAMVVDVEELDSDEVVSRSGFNDVDDLMAHLEDKYGEDYKEHKYVVLVWEA